MSNSTRLHQLLCRATSPTALAAFLALPLLATGCEVGTTGSTGVGVGDDDTIVCGDDGVTYECPEDAHEAGASVAYFGPCHEQPAADAGPASEEDAGDRPIWCGEDWECPDDHYCDHTPDPWDAYSTTYPVYNEFGVCRPNDVPPPADAGVPPTPGTDAGSPPPPCPCPPPPPSCDEHADCGEGRACHEDPECTGVLCVGVCLGVEVGTPCGDLAACDVGLNLLCDAGLGICVNAEVDVDLDLANIGDACDEDLDCAVGLGCDIGLGTCVELDLDIELGRPGEHCDSNEDCSVGLGCELGLKICLDLGVHLGGRGGACGAHDTCNIGLLCLLGICL